MIKRKGKINEDRLADLIALRNSAKDAYDAAVKASKEEQNSYDWVNGSIEDELKREIFRQITSLSGADTSRVHVNVRGFAPENDRSYFRGYVRIDNGDRPFDDQALNWHFEAEVSSFKDTDEISFDSGAWSGLDVTTPEKVENLKNDVKILEAINKLDWSKIFSKKFPKISDYVKTKVPSEDTYTQYDNEIFIEKLQNMINNNDAFIIGGNNNQKTFYAPEKISAKTITFRVYTKDFIDPKELYHLNNKRYSLDDVTKFFKNAEIVSLNDYTEAK